MRAGDFELCIVGGHERLDRPEVEMRHGQVYQLVLSNHGARQCDAAVKIDGKPVGTWRVPAGQQIVLERPSDQTGKFTFFLVGTAEAETTNVREDAFTGMVETAFIPEKQAPLRSQRAAFLPARSPNPVKTNVGGTGLSGKSEQQYGTATNIEYDREAQVVLRLRLVGLEASPMELQPIKPASLISAEQKQFVYTPAPSVRFQAPTVQSKTPTQFGCLSIIKGAAVVLVILVGLIVVGGYLAEQNRRTEEELSKHRISFSEVELSGLTLTTLPYSSSRTLEGRIRNHSASFTIISVTLKITLRDVKQNGENEVIGQNDVAIYAIVPPNQTRAVNTSVYFADLPTLHGNLEWSYVLEEVRAH